MPVHKSSLIPTLGLILIAASLLVAPQWQSPWAVALHVLALISAILGYAVWQERRLGREREDLAKPGSAENPTVPDAEMMAKQDAEDAAEDPETQALRRILVVDDEEVIRLVLRRQLTTVDYEIREAKNGSEALRLLEEEAFDLVILDVMMPEMSGYEVCRQLRQRFGLRELPVIFFSARDQTSDLVRGFEAGGNDYLTKPVSYEELLARVGVQLAQRPTANAKA